MYAWGRGRGRSRERWSRNEGRWQQEPGAVPSKVRICTSLERTICSAGAKALGDGCGAQLPVSAVLIVKVCTGVIEGIPRKSAVPVPDSAQGPTSRDLLDPIVTSSEDYGLPQSKKFEGVADVVVGAAVSVSRIVR